MKIALIGATGYVGSKLLAEALHRGHDVTAIVRDPHNLPEHQALTSSDGDVTHAETLTSLVAGHDVVISAFNPGLDPDGTGTQAIIDGVRRAGVPRFLTVGGAGTLHLPSGERVVDQPDFPAEWKAGALRTAAFLDQLRNEQELEWVFLSPAAHLVPGERTGSYRVGRDDLQAHALGLLHDDLEL